MPVLIAAIHGILTRQTDPSWPDKFQAWLAQADPAVRVIEKKYSAGPFPRWNCWVKNPLVARALASEIEERIASGGSSGEQLADLWFVAHSNGACIALLTAKELIARGCPVAGLILSGAACEADLARNGVLELLRRGTLGRAIAYSSPDDEIVAGDGRAPKNWLWKIRDCVWGGLMWPYGSLGRTGWLYVGTAVDRLRVSPEGTVSLSGPEESAGFDGLAITRWFQGGHCSYFQPERREGTFEAILSEIRDATDSGSAAVYNLHGAAKVET